MLYIVLLFSHLNFNNPGMQKVNIGSTIPQFELMDQDGKLFSIDSVLGKKNLVIFFYPKDFGLECTRQACSFQDQYMLFKDAEAMVIGISSQSVESHLRFAKKYNLDYTLLSDKGNKVRKLFGVPGNLFGLIPGRVTYVVNKKGEVIYMFNSQTKPLLHVEKSLEILKEME